MSEYPKIYQNNLKIETQTMLISLGNVFSLAYICFVVNML